MVVAEALAHGVPVIATAVGGVAEALGHAADRTRPGLLVPVDDAPALAEAIRSWLTDRAASKARRAAADRRRTLLAWSSTAAVIGSVLTAVSAA